jgi:phosphoribosylformylglycinamidine synthase
VATPESKLLRIPIAHGDGCYFADAETLDALEQHGQILWHYTDANGTASEEANPNGSLRNIAGICNRRGNVAGLMPHPERASEPILGNTDGKWIWESIITFQNSIQFDLGGSRPIAVSFSGE